MTCQKCKTEIGKYSQSQDGRWWIALDTVAIYSAHGICANCGEEWHYASTDKQLEELIKKCVAK